MLDKISILIVGASGTLGSLITKEALKRPNLHVNILVRDPTKASSHADDVTNAGGRVIKGDLSNISSLKDATKGIHTVVSALSSIDQKTFVDGHIALIDDAVKNGVTRFVPSNFGVRYDLFTKEETDRCSLVDAKIKIDNYLNSTPLKQLSISCGSIMETFFLTQKKTLGYWGEPNRLYNFTSYADIAAFTAEAVSNKDKKGHLVVAGSDLTYAQALEKYNKIRGTNVEPKRLGSLADLKNVYEGKIKEKDFVSATFIGLFLIIFDERSTFTRNDNNVFPNVKLTSFDEFVSQHDELKL